MTVTRILAEQLPGEPPRDVHAAVRLELRRLLDTEPADPWFAAPAEAARMRFDEHVWIHMPGVASDEAAR